MRWYAIKIDGAPADIFPPVPGASIPGAQWDTWVNGQNDPNGQQVVINFFTIRPSEPINDASTLMIYGVSWKQVGQYANLCGKLISVWGGMRPGLPLASIQAQNAGLLIQGRIQQCWGEFTGTEQYIGMSIVQAGSVADTGQDSNTPSSDSAPQQGGGASVPGAGTPLSISQRYSRTGPRSIDRRNLPVSRSIVGTAGTVQSPVDMLSGFVSQLGGSDFGAAVSSVGGQISSFFGGGGGLVNPLNFIHNMQANMPLSSAIQETLSKVFPNAKIDIKISPLLKLAYQDAGMYQNFEQYASYIKNLSHSIMGTKNYLGVQTAVNGNKIIVYDGTQPSGGSTISIYELVGQPTWVKVLEVQVTVVMRAGIEVNNIITLPANIPFAVSQGSVIAGTSDQRNLLTFNGSLNVQYVRNVGDFRNPDGRQWVTIYDCLIESPGSGDQQNTPTPPAPDQTQTPTPSPADQLAEGVIPLSVGPPAPGPWKLNNRPVRKY